MKHKEILKQWIEEYVDVYGKQPSEELISKWSYEITITFFSGENE